MVFVCMGGQYKKKSVVFWWPGYSLFCSFIIKWDWYKYWYELSLFWIIILLQDTDLNMNVILEDAAIARLEKVKLNPDGQQQDTPQFTKLELSFSLKGIHYCQYIYECKSELKSDVLDVGTCVVAAEENI